MAADENPTVQPPQGPPLAVDSEIEQALWEHSHEDDPEAAYQQIVSSLTEADEPRALWGLGRAYARLQDEVRALISEREMVVSEFTDAITKRVTRAHWLTASIEASVKARRGAGLGNFIDIPGVGRWTSRKTQPGWDLPTRVAEVDALIAWMRKEDPDAYPTIVKNVLTLDTTALRAWLDEKPDADGLPPGVVFREADVSVSGPGL